MNLYLVRHADAEERKPGMADAERELTAKGREQAQRAAAWLKRQGARIEALVSSPLVRARQTAEPIAEALGVKVIEDVRLAGLRLSAEAVGKLARELGIGESLLLVGHEPDLSDLIRELTRGQVEMKKAAVALVQCEALAPGEGVLAWLVPSKLQE